MTTSRFGLTLEWTQLTPNFTNEVLHSKQVRFRALEPTLSAFFTLAIFEDTRRFFDDRPSILGARIQHCVDLTLTDDDVLLTTDTCVGQQLLDVEQSTFDTVDGVLAVAVSKQRSTDRDLGELERKHP